MPLRARFHICAILWCAAVICILSCAAKRGRTARDVSLKSDQVYVSLKSGQDLRGVRSTVSDDVVHRFYGIPYAAPPTGENRYQPPQPAEAWTGVRDASEPGPVCPQAYDLEPQSEDCLYLDIFTPDINRHHNDDDSESNSDSSNGDSSSSSDSRNHDRSSSNSDSESNSDSDDDGKEGLPVFVWIHGGGYKLGSKDKEISGDLATFAPYGVIVVGINYRLGALGFLSTGDDVMPGNYGMLDQVMALKWVNENIRAFGGDPKKVTIGGQSAGAMSVSLLVLSPLAEGLFQRATMFSGSSFVGSAIERPGKTTLVTDFTRAIADKVGCDQIDSSEFLGCLRAADAGALVKASKELEEELDIGFPAAPRVETTFGFMPDMPTNLIAAGRFNKVDTLRGFTSGEYSSSIKDDEDDGVTRAEFPEYFQAFYKRNKYYEEAEITRLVEDFYLDDLTDTFEIRSSLKNAITDVFYAGGVVLELTEMLENPDFRNRHHYLYQFNYRDSQTDSPEWYGVTHASDLRTVFLDLDSASATSTDRSVARAVQTLWTNFIKFGNPTPEDFDIDDVDMWDQYTTSDPNMLTIDDTSSLNTYPRPGVIPLYRQLVDLMNTKIEEK